MQIYPDRPKPNRITPISTAPYKGFRAEFRDGNTQNIRTQFVVTGQAITLEYQAIQPDDLNEIWSFWDLVGGKYGTSFVLPAAIFYHPTAVIGRIARDTNTYWRFEDEQLSMSCEVCSQEKTIIVEGQPTVVLPDCGIYSVNINLKGAIA